MKSMQRRQAGEHGPGERSQVVIVQLEGSQRRQAGEHGPGKRIQFVGIQFECFQRRQTGERPGVDRTQLAASQLQAFQRRQAGEHVRGKRGEGVSGKFQGFQVRQPREVARLQRRDVLTRHLQGDRETLQVGDVHLRASPLHAVEVLKVVDDVFMHLLRAVADAGRRRHRVRLGRRALVVVGVHRAELEGVGDLVGEARHREAVLVRAAHAAVRDPLPVAVGPAPRLVPVLVARHARIRRRRVPRQHDLRVAHRRREIRRRRQPQDPRGALDGDAKLVALGEPTAYA